MGSGSTVGQYHFDAWDLPTKYGWMHSGPGVAAATLTQDLVKRMSERMISSGELVGRLLDGAEWVGAAAAAAGQAMQRGAEQINQSAAGAVTAQRCVTELGESFAATQHRVPSPNEIPSGLGDKFLFGAAEGFNAVSPFDVQSPIHEAMAQRRELDAQANQALTDHMTASRERLEAIPTVAAPPPMTVTTQSAAATGSGGVGYPTAAVPADLGAANAPTSTPGTGWGGSVGGTNPRGSGSPGPSTSPVTGGAAIPPGTTSPMGTGTAEGGVAAYPSGRSQSSQLSSSTAGPGPGQAVFGAGGGGRTGGEPTRRPVFGSRPGTGGTTIPGRGTSGLGGAPVPGGAGDPAPRGGGVPGGAGGARGSGASSFLQPPVGGRSQGEQDTEHTDRYARQTDHLVGELPLVAPAVIGETPQEEAARLRRLQEGK